MKYFNFLLLFFLIACSSDDPTNPIIKLTTSDFTVSVEENPELNQELGTIETSINDGSVSFNIDEISVDNAISIDQNTGVVKVVGPSLFDFEAREQITGIISVSNGGTTEYSNLTINIIDLFDENILRLAKIVDPDPLNYNYGIGICDANLKLTYDANDFFKKYSSSRVDKSWYYSVQHDGSKITEYKFWLADYGVHTNIFYFTYGPDGRISSFINEMTYSGEPTNTYNFEVIYNGNTIEVKSLESNSSSFIMMNDNGLVKSIISGSTIIGEYEYDENGNLTLFTDEYGRTREYTYDTKRNPFRDIVDLNWNEVLNIRFTRWSPGMDNGIWRNKNNIIKVEENSGLLIHYALEYNSDGYPKKRTFNGLNQPLEYIYQ